MPWLWQANYQVVPLILPEHTHILADVKGQAYNYMYQMQATETSDRKESISDSVHNLP